MLATAWESCREEAEEDVRPADSGTADRRWTSARRPRHWALPGLGGGGDPRDEMVEQPPVLAGFWSHFTFSSFADPLWTRWIAKLLSPPLENKATAMLLLSRDSKVVLGCTRVSVSQSFIADKLTGVVNPPCRAKHFPLLYLWTGPGANSWVQSSPRAEAGRCEMQGGVTDCLKPFCIWVHLFGNRAGTWVHWFLTLCCWWHCW